MVRGGVVYVCNIVSAILSLVSDKDCTITTSPSVTKKHFGTLDLSH